MLALVGAPVLSVRSCTGETLGCSAGVREPAGPGWAGTSQGALPHPYSVVCPLWQPAIVTLVE